MVGFGSIGKGTLPMIERHLDYDKSRVTVIDPKDEGRKAHCEKQNVRFIQKAVTRDNYRELLTPLLTEGGGQGFCVNLSVDTGSTDIMELCNELGALYIDTVNEPWLGFYFDSSKGPEARSNYALREATLAAKRARPAGSTTAVSCCGANPGMMMVMSSSPRLIRRSSTSATSDEESPAMASSEIKSFGRTAIARASSILRSSTWLSVSLGASAFAANPMRLRIDIATSSSGRLEPTEAKSSPTMRFSSTVMLLNGRGI